MQEWTSIGYVLDYRLDEAKELVLRILSVNALYPSVGDFVRPENCPLQFALLPEPSGFIFRPFDSRGQGKKHDRIVDNSGSDIRLHQTELTGGFICPPGWAAGCLELKVALFLNDRSVFPFVIDERTEHSSITTKDLKEMAFFRARELTHSVCLSSRHLLKIRQLEHCFWKTVAWIYGNTDSPSIWSANRISPRSELSFR